MSLKQLFAIAVMAALTVPFATAQQRTKERIGVISFDNLSQVKEPNFARSLMDVLSAQLAKNKKYTLLERGQIQAVLGETVLGMQGITDAKAMSFGKQAGLNYVFLGSITDVTETVESRFNPAREALYNKKGEKISPAQPAYTEWWKSTRVNVSVKMVDVETGSIKFQETSGASDKTDPSRTQVYADYRNYGLYSQLASTAIARIVDNMGVGTEATLIEISADEAMIDIGSEDGVMPGQVFAIIMEGDAVRHPRTGEIVSVRETVMGYFEITRADASTATGRMMSRLRKEYTSGFFSGEKTKQYEPIVPEDQSVKVRQIARQNVKHPKDWGGVKVK